MRGGSPRSMIEGQVLMAGGGGGRCSQGGEIDGVRGGCDGDRGGRAGEVNGWSRHRLCLRPPKFNIFGVNAFFDVKHFCLTSKNCFYVKIVLTSKTCLTSKACVTSKDVSSSTNMFDVKIVLKKNLKMSKDYDSHVLCSCRSCFYCRSCSAAPAGSSRNSR